MTLKKGTMLGPYEVLESLGAGGMGEVYRARDTRLERTVAVKVLSSSLNPTPELRSRFEREAKAVSQLSHPHICTLYDIRRERDIDFLIMEYIEGKTLAARLDSAKAKAPGEEGRPALDVDEALRFAVEIAGALNHAHQRGVIHRDLKPANIMLTKAGVKLLDFGLAKLKKPPAAGQGDLATASLAQTEEGMILGTIPYMSPEQLEGAEADARSDIFALGAVIYEMLTGRRAFEGRSQASVIAAILRQDPPPPATLQPLTPTALDHVVRRCLAKNPDDRWQTAQDVAAELRWIAEDRRLALTPSRDQVPAEAQVGVRPAKKGRRRLPILAGIVFLLASAALVAFFFREKLGLRPHRPQHLQIDVKPAERLSTMVEAPAYQPSRTAIALSPDGLTLVFSGRGLTQAEKEQRLFRRSLTLETAEAEPLPGSESGSCPFFSPDGRWVGYFAEGTLRKIPLRGGTPVDICRVPGFFGASWGSDGTVVFAQDLLDGLWQVSSDGGIPRALTSLDRTRGEVSHRLPAFLPGARSVVYTVLRNATVNWLKAEIALKSLDTGEVRILAEDAADARFMPPDILLFMRRGTLMAAPFDKDRLVLKGGTTVAVRDVMQTINTGHRISDSGSGQYAVSESGSLAYVLGGITREQEFSLAWRDLAGSAQTLQIKPKSYLMPQVSPDARRALIWTMTLPRTVWLIDLERQVPMPLLVEGNASFPIWSPEGKTVTFLWARDEGFSLARMPVDGSSLPEILLTSDKLIFPLAWSRDGRILMYQDPEGELRLLENEGDEWKSRSWMQPPLKGEAPSLSPDGRWMAYDTYDAEAGKFQVYIARFPGPGGRQLITTDPAVHPVWAPSGRDLYFTVYASYPAGSHKFVSVPVTPGDPPAVGKPRILFEAQWGLTGPGRAYDLAPDGKKILCVLPDQRAYPAPPSQIRVITRWPEELKAKIAGN